MPGRNKASVAVASAGNVQLMATAEVSQQPAVLCTVAGMITFKSVQFFIDQPGQIFLHAGAVKIAGQMRADCNAARLMDDRNHFCNRRKIRKAQIVFLQSGSAHCQHPFAPAVSGYAGKVPATQYYDYRFHNPEYGNYARLW